MGVTSQYGCSGLIEGGYTAATTDKDTHFLSETASSCTILIILYFIIWCPYLRLVVPNFSDGEVVLHKIEGQDHAIIHFYLVPLL